MPGHGVVHIVEHDLVFARMADHSGLGIVAHQTGVEPPNHSYIATWQRSHVFRPMSGVGSTNAYRLNGNIPTNGYVLDASPVTGATIRMVLPAQ